MKKNRFLSIILFSLLLTGCIGVNTEFKNTRNLFFENSQVKYKTEFELGFGKGLLSLAGMFINAADEESEYIDDIIKEVSHVQVGSYIVNSDDINLYRSNLSRLIENLKKSNWSYIVKNISYSEINLVFVKDNFDENDKEMTILVINLEGNELYIAEIEGNLVKAIKYAFKEKGIRIASNF